VQSCINVFQAKGIRRFTRAHSFKDDCLKFDNRSVKQYQSSNENYGKRDQEHDFWAEMPERIQYQAAEKIPKSGAIEVLISNLMQFKLIVSEKVFAGDDRLIRK
jgi:hypothetical protein